jgi:hypothetical protein
MAMEEVGPYLGGMIDYNILMTRDEQVACVREV